MKKRVLISLILTLAILSALLAGCSKGISGGKTVSGSVDYETSITNATQPILFHIKYEVPEGYEVTFPQKWANVDNERYKARMSKLDLNSQESFWRRTHDLELVKDGEIVFSIDFISKPSYYESFLKVLAYDLIPREESLTLNSLYFDNVSQLEKNGCLYTTGCKTSLYQGKEIPESKFALVDLKSSKKLALSMHVPANDTTEHLLEYADFFTVSAEDPTEAMRGLIRNEYDPIPNLFAKETLESALGKVNVGYYSYEGYEVTFPKKTDPAAENELEVIRGGEVVYSARIISQADYASLKAQYESDAGYSAASLSGRPNSELEKVGKRQFDFVKKQTEGTPESVSLIELIDRDFAVRIESHLPQGDGTLKGSAYPFFNYSAAE